MLSFKKIENIKKPKATIAKRKLNVANGDPYSTITLPVINEDDHNKIKINGKIFVIFVL